MIAFAQAATDRRFVFIIQRGAADGLGTLAPTGDPAFAGLRGAFAEDFANGAKLGASSPSTRASPQAATLYQAREALFVHAVASPYRDRSHFDGQNVLETGGTAAYRLRDGWMNRLLGLLPANEAKAIAVSATVPVALRGSREVASYAPSQPARARPTICSPASAASTRRTRSCTPPGTEAMQTRAWPATSAPTAARTAPPPARSPRGCSPARTARGSR